VSYSFKDNAKNEQKRQEESQIRSVKPYEKVREVGYGVYMPILIKTPSDEILARIYEYISYNSITGELTWLKRRSNRCKAGMLIGAIKSDDGRRQFELFGYHLYAYRAAWFLYYGEWPTNEIDHINGDVDDNRICNMREVGRRINMTNCKIHRSGKVPGYTFDKDRKLFSASIQINKKRISLGRYKKRSDAILAYNKKREEIGE